MNRSLGMVFIIVISYAWLLKGAEEGNRFPLMTTGSLGNDATMHFATQQRRALAAAATPELALKLHIEDLGESIKRVAQMMGKVTQEVNDYDYVVRPATGDVRIKFLQEISTRLKKAHLALFEMQSKMGESAGRVEMKLSNEQAIMHAKMMNPPRPDVVYAEQNGALINGFLQPLLKRIKFHDNEDLKWLLFYFAILLDTAKKGLPVTVRVEGWHTQLLESSEDVQRFLEKYNALREYAEELFHQTLLNKKINKNKET